RFGGLKPVRSSRSERRRVGGLKPVPSLAQRAKAGRCIRATVLRPRRFGEKSQRRKTLSIKARRRGIRLRPRAPPFRLRAPRFGGLKPVRSSRSERRRVGGLKPVP